MRNKNQNNKKNKEIVFKTPEFPHISETFVIAQILTAINLGYDIKIITRKVIRNNFSLIGNYNLLNKIIIDDYKIPKNKIIRSLKWGFLLVSNLKDIFFIIKYFTSQKKFSLTWLYEWVFYKQFNKANIIHVQYGTYKHPLDLLKKTGFFKPKIIVTFHGHDAFFPLYGYIENNGYYQNLFNNNILITANTEYLANKIVELGCPKEKIEILPVGVNTSFFEPVNRDKSNKNSIKLITVGRLDKVKGHQYCIEVVNKLIKKGINVTLTIIGEGKERSNLELLVKKFELENNIFLLGSKEPNEVRSEFWTHDIYLLLAVPVEFERRETQGLATLEAQACGLPAIVFDSGGVKYTVKNKVSGFVCKEFDIEEVINKVELLSNNTEILDNMRQNAIEFVNNEFSQTIMDSKWKLIYNKIENE